MGVNYVDRIPCRVFRHPTKNGTFSVWMLVDSSISRRNIYLPVPAKAQPGFTCQLWSNKNQFEALNNTIIVDMLLN